MTAIDENKPHGSDFPWGLRFYSVLRFPLGLVGLPPCREGGVFRGEGGFNSWFRSRSIIFLHKRVNTVSRFRQVIQFSNHCMICCPLCSVVSEEVPPSYGGGVQTGTFGTGNPSPTKRYNTHRCHSEERMRRRIFPQPVAKDSSLRAE